VLHSLLPGKGAEMKFTIEHCDNHFVLTVTGAIDPDALVEMITSLLAHEAWKPDTPVLVDESGMDASDASVASVRDIAHACSKGREQFGQARIAILVARDMEYGMNRMWMSFVDGKWDAECNVFRSEKDARIWISS